jgi:hypothetical protein
VLLLVSVPLTGAAPGSPASAAPALVPVGQVLGWVLNLAVAEVVIRRRRARTSPRSRTTAKGRS